MRHACSFSFDAQRSARLGAALRQVVDASAAPDPSPAAQPSPPAAAAAAAQATDGPVLPTSEASAEPFPSPETLSGGSPAFPAESKGDSFTFDFLEIIIALVVILLCVLVGHFFLLRWRRRRSADNAQYLPTSVPPGTNSLHPDHSFAQQSSSPPPDMYRPTHPSAF